MLTPPLKFTIRLHHSGTLPAWETEMLKELLSRGEIEILAFTRENEKSETSLSWGLRLFQRFETWWFTSIPDAFEKIPVTKSFPEVKISDNEEDSHLPAVDIAYCSCLATPPRMGGSRANYGSWYFSFGSGEYRDVQPFAFWELMDNLPEIRSRLLVKKRNSAGEIVVYDGSISTIPFSVKNNVNCIAWKSASFLQFRLGELLNKGAEKFFETHNEIVNPDEGREATVKRSPAGLQATRLFIKNVLGYFLSRGRGLFTRKRFTLSVRKGKFDHRSLDLSQFRSFELPKNVFWADPFILTREGKEYVIFEEFINSENKGRISVAKLPDLNEPLKPVPVLEKPYHLSYPFVFEFGGSTYMVPESSQNKTVELYRCSEFPYKWEFVMNLMNDTVLIDPTLLFHDEKWWMFGTGEGKPFLSSNDQLFLYYSQDLFSSRWTVHPSNPIATRISNCRSAGRIFRSGEKLYRPAQNNASRQYGYAIRINEIEILNENEYKEKELYEILPDGHRFQAIHTLNFTDNTIVIDSIRK